MRHKIAIGIFNIFVKIPEAGPKLKHRQRNSCKFLTSGTECTSSSFSVKDHNNIHPLN